MFKYPFIFDILKRRKEKGKDDRVRIHPPPPPPPDRFIRPEDKSDESKGDDGEVDFNIDKQNISLVIFK